VEEGRTKKKKKKKNYTIVIIIMQVALKIKRSETQGETKIATECSHHKVMLS
jgi:hypothetical protein